MSVTRRGFLGALMAVPLVRLLAHPKTTTVAVTNASAQSFDEHMLRHELDLRHSEARAFNDVLPEYERRKLDREIQSLRDRYGKTFPGDFDHPVTGATRTRWAG